MKERLGLHSCAYESKVRNREIYDGVGRYSTTNADFITFFQYVNSEDYIAYGPYGPVIEPSESNHSVVKKFITLLDDYINTKAQREGLPSVAWFADKCCLSTGYFGTLVKTETGRAAKDIIADRLLSHAKQLLNDDKLTITIISNRLGFDYPQHFVRFFKTHTGKPPSAYRKAS